MGARRLRLTSPAIVVTLALAIVAACTGSVAHHPAIHSQEVAARSVMSSVVATAHPEATRAGLEVLRSGGNAVDAAVAAAFAIAVVEPHASGLGGEGVFIAYLADVDEVVTIDYKSVAPLGVGVKGATPNQGYGSAAIPGMVAGLCMALKDHGTTSLADALAPAIQLAEQGFEVSPGLAIAALDNFEALSADPPLAQVMCPNGLPVEQGAQLAIPDLAATLRSIAADGAGGFYTGPFASALERAAAQQGVTISTRELADYQPIRRQPLAIDYRGYTVLTTPGPTGGLTVLENLNVFRHLGPIADDHLSVESVHLMTEVLRRGFADYRAHIGDPAFVQIPAELLLSDDYAKRRASAIRRDGISEDITTGVSESWESPSTTALVAVDSAGNLVAITQTLSSLFGARVMVPGTGVILNNELKNFSTTGPNACQPAKRPRTSIAPVIILHGDRPFAAVATPGAGRIISTTTQLIVNLLDRDMRLQDAVDAPRYYAHNTELRLDVEGSLPATTVEGLQRLGYPIRILRALDPYFGGAQAVMIDESTGGRIGAADPRRDGTADGF